MKATYTKKRTNEQKKENQFTRKETIKNSFDLVVEKKEENNIHLVEAEKLLHKKIA